MHFLHNLFGWFDGTSEVATARSTPIAPPNLSVTTTPGELRANWIGIPGAEWANRVYVTPPEIDSLAPVRAAIWEQIKAIRDRKTQTGGYTTGGKWFHSDTFSRTQQIGLMLMGASVPAVPWKTLDGSFVTMTQALAGQIFGAAALQDQALFGHAEALRAAVDAAPDPSSVDINAGWPATFGAS